MFAITADRKAIPSGIADANLSFFFCFVMLGVTSAEFFDASSRIHQFLFTGEKRMTIGADLHLELREYRTDFKRTTAGTSRGNGFIFWMYIFFHDSRVLQVSSKSDFL